MNTQVTQKQITQFLESKRIAVAGVSNNPKKFGYQIFSQLRQKGYEILPLNPHHDEIDGIACAKSVDELPDSVESLLILTPKSQTDSVLEKAIRSNIPNIWVQQSCETETSLQLAKDHQKEVIFKKCIFMFAEPVSGVHKFHRGLVKIFGLYPHKN